MATTKTKKKVPRNLIAWGKVLSFLLATVVGGLIQLWILYLVLRFGQGASPNLAIMLGDGGLFFFATSLIASSIVSLTSKRQLRIGTVDFNVTLLFTLLVLLSSVVIYSSVLAAQLGSSQPFCNYIFTQIGCAVAAITYGIFVSVRTGQFRR